VWTVAGVIIGPLVGVILILWPASVLPGQPWAAPTSQPPHRDGAPHGVLSVRISEGRLSLTAQNASLKGVFEAIGRQLAIEVVTRIPADERITLAFEQLSLTEVLMRLRPYVNYVVLEDAAKAPGTIRQLIVISKRVAGIPSHQTPPDSKGLVLPAPSQSDGATPGAPVRPKPFTFEFDPAAVGEHGR
jgi:hypothetical protein